MGSAVMGHCLQRKAKPTRDERARVARCKTWRMVDDGRPGHAFPTCDELLVQKDTPASEVKVKVKPRGGGGGEALTSFSPAVLQLTTPTVMTDFSPLDSPPTTAHTLDNLPAPSHFANKQTKQTDDTSMTSLQSKGRTRIKYKEPPMLEESTIATTNSDAHLQASRAQPTEPPHTPTHSSEIDLAALTSARITSPLEIALNPIESITSPAHQPPTSSAARNHNVKKSTNSAVEMDGKSKPPGRKEKQPRPLAEDDQELVFKGRSEGRSNATRDSWRWDPALGALVSKNSGASYQPPVTSEASNQRPTAAFKPDAAFAGNNKLEDSLWAREMTADNGWGATDDQNDWKPTTANASWDTGHPPYPNKARLDAEESKRKEQARKSAKPSLHNKARRPRESPWIKGSLIPKGDPKRHKMRRSSSESSSFDSDRASSGWITRKKCDQHNDSAELADWAGGIGPASIDWDSRSRFRDHQSAAKIENWLDQNLISMEQVEAANIATDGSSFTQGNGGIAPKYWFVAHLDGKSAKFFWQQHIDPQADEVKPCDEEDLQSATPWWDNYLKNEHSMLKPFEHPEVAGIDPDENTEQRRARENDKGAVHAGESRKAAERAKREVQRKRILAKREKAHKFSGTHDPSSNAIKPGLALFLRPAAKDDMVPLRDIYNRYIDNAFIVPEIDRLTETDMLARWQAIKNAKLPFIVACQRGEVIKARNKKLYEDMVMADKVVGFACAADWSDGTCIYRPTVKLEVFVHMEQYMKQVGSCLADKTMALLDPQFVDRGGYDIDESLRGPPLRTVSNILVRYSYEAEKTDKLKWVSKWLKTRFGFEQVADLKGVAEKFDKQLNLAILQKTIG